MKSCERERDNTLSISLAHLSSQPNNNATAKYRERERIEKNKIFFDDKSEENMKELNVQQVLIEASEKKEKTIEFINKDNGKNKTHFDLFNLVMNKKLCEV